MLAPHPFSGGADLIHAQFLQNVLAHRETQPPGRQGTEEILDTCRWGGLELSFRPPFKVLAQVKQ